MTTDLFPTDPKRIRERISRYERALKRELEEGYGGDGYGKRYLRGPLYMLKGDVDGALTSFDWYKDAYPDDSGDPYQYLTWGLALFLFRDGCRQEAFDKLYQTMLENLYLVPRMVQIFERTVWYCYQTILRIICSCNDKRHTTFPSPRNCLGRLA